MACFKKKKKRKGKDREQAEEGQEDLHLRPNEDGRLQSRSPGQQSDALRQRLWKI
jgi:hypothetical protein